MKAHIMSSMKQPIAHWASLIKLFTNKFLPKDHLEKSFVFFFFYLFFNLEKQIPTTGRITFTHASAIIKVSAK